MNKNELINAIASDFTAHLVPDAECLYLSDPKKDVFSVDEDKLNALGFDMSQEKNMPDVVLYQKDKDWIYLIESIVTGGVIDEVRFGELDSLTKNVEKNKVFVTAFPDIQSFKDYSERLAWDTVAWIAEMPDHLIHFEKQGILSPR